MKHYTMLSRKLEILLPEKFTSLTHYLQNVVELERAMLKEHAHAMRDRDATLAQLLGWDLAFLDQIVNETLERILQ